MRLAGLQLLGRFEPAQEEIVALVVYSVTSSI
jgi:hypothetical protein